MLEFGLIRSPRSVIFGSGQRAALGAVARSIGARAFICTDERMAASSEFGALTRHLSEAGVATNVFDRTLVDVPLHLVAAAADAARGFGPDIVIGVGGGSCLDLAKAAALIYSHGGSARDYYGEGKVPAPVVPIICLPTTAGTGSEVTPVAVLSDPDRVLKVGISSPHLIPAAAICDPELTLTCPPVLTAISGADALCHAIEAFTAIRRTPTPDLPNTHVFVGRNALSDHFARAAIELIFAHLERACTHGEDLAAREAVMMGALCAGMAFGVAGTALAHALQYPLGAATGTAHGAGVAALLPYVMEFNHAAVPMRFAEIARLIGAGGDGNEDRAGEVAIDAVAKLFASIGIPKSLRDMGLAADRRDWLARESLGAARLINNNPRKVGFEEARRVVEFAYTGDLAAAREDFRGT